jgi:hypothetical protein
MRFFYFSISLLFILIISPINSFAQAIYTEMDVTQEKNKILVDMSLEKYNQNLIIESLEKGLRSEITFFLRIFKENSGIVRIFGDQLIEEYTYTSEASKDIFQRGYTIQSDGITKIISETQKFNRDFYSLYGFPINSSLIKKGNYYLMGRIRIKRVKLVPPFNLITLFWNDIIKTTGWNRVNISSMVED